MKVIVCSNIKGGVGKTTTAHLLIEGLRRRGYKVIGIDLDQQRNLSSNYEVAEVGSYDLFKTDVLIDAVIYNDFISASARLRDIDNELNTKLGKEFILKKKLSAMKSQYDFVIIDTSPSTNLATLNAYVVADYLIVPSNANSYNLESIKDVFDFANGVKEYYNPNLVIGGVLLTRYKDKGVFNTTMKEMIDEVVQANHSKVFKTYIRENSDISVAVGIESNVFKYKPSSNGAKDYDQFIEELLGDIVPDYQSSILTTKGLEVFDYIKNISMDRFIEELSNIFINPKKMPGIKFINELSIYTPLTIKVVVLWATQYKNAFQSINYYKKILESHCADSKEPLALFKELYKIGD